MKKLYDVLAVNVALRTIRLIAQGKTLGDAAAIVSIAVMRRGVGLEFFVEVPEGSYQEGELWVGQKETA